MSIQVKLHIEDQIINILEHQLAISQNADYFGKPSSKPTGEPIEFTYKSLKKDPFIDKIVTGKLIDSLKLVFSPVQMNGKSTTIELLDLYVLGHHVNYIGDNNIPMTSSVKVSFATFIAEGQIMDVKYWRTTDPFQNTQPTTNHTEENEDEEKDFKILIKHIKSKETFVPLGIPAYNGTKENKTLDFEIEVQQNEIESYKIEILQDDKVIFTVNSGEEGLPQTFDVGKHTFKWDGFDSNGIYDSKVFIKGKLKAKVTGKLEGNTKTAESDEISFERKEVDWVDAIINKNTKRIDINLRVNLRDGGEIGTEKECHTIGSGNYSPVRKICPWDDIPEKVIRRYGTPIKTRTKKIKELKNLALNGISTYWSRRYTNTEGTVIQDDNWEIVITAVYDSNGMVAPKIIYFTNSEETNFTRSHNWELSRKLFYKIGYLKSKTWDYQDESVSDIDFSETSAHEIGHEILLAYGGQMYSKKHKGTSSIMQDVINKNDYPLKGEIDLMKYYNGYYPSDFYERSVASKKDVLSLIWLTKIILK